ncbi:MAG: hypothetical protein KDN19_05330 [Verrucomicrobiae bacterium]|nr:hypothetical protein [Verrucomicrobiae bacterium]
MPHPFSHFLLLPPSVVFIIAILTGCVSAERPAGSPAGASISGGKIQLPPADAAAIGRRIWQNECAGTIEGLTSWNAGEDFPSLGIGHFIWYVPGRPGPFEESFPQLIAFMKSRQVPGLPAWLANARGCPWPNRESFLAQQNSPQMRELRQFLANTVSVQTDFIVHRLENALPKMESITHGADRDRLRANFYKVAQSRNGVYALIDYVNFKGEGIKPEERYQGQGWGLRDVLLEMRDTPGGPASVAEFSEAAKRVLQRRVRNSPPDRGESRWLNGWMNRCAGYRSGL